MRTSPLLFVSAALLLLSACAHLNSAPSESVEQVERRRFAAMVAQDVAALEPMLAEDLRYIHSNGQLESKPQFLETIRSGRLRYREVAIQELDVRSYKDVAVITGLLAVDAQAGDQPVTLKLRFTDVYVSRDGRWQLVAWQSARLP
jgi:ketosteroid isomerase-like protein